MRKITKICDLSTEYKKWEEGLEANNKNHPPFQNKGEGQTTRNKYYEDVKMQLLRCQDGLCAYTEIRLCFSDFYDISKWKNNKSIYTKDNRSGTGTGSLEHFDSSLKKNKGWLWDNFFVIFAALNTEKNAAQVSDFLKPDRDDYDPKKWFSYDEKTDMFTPNTKLSDELKEMIRVSIKSLGLNNPGIVPHRYNELKRRKTDLEFGNVEQAKSDLNQFYTAMDFLIEIYRKKEEEKESLYDFY